MQTFDVQSIEINAPFSKVFTYVAEPGNLPEWTSAFQQVSGRRALLRTPAGSVGVDLEVTAVFVAGTIDWTLRFPDGSVARAFSRVIPTAEERSIYTFVLMAPPVPLEQLEGTLKEQSRTLSEELDRLNRILSS